MVFQPSKIFIGNSTYNPGISLARVAACKIGHVVIEMGHGIFCVMSERWPNLASLKDEGAVLIPVARPQRLDFENVGLYLWEYANRGSIAEQTLEIARRRKGDCGPTVAGPWTAIDTAEKTISDNVAYDCWAAAKVPNSELKTKEYLSLCGFTKFVTCRFYENMRSDDCSRLCSTRVGSGLPA